MDACASFLRDFRCDSAVTGLQTHSKAVVEAVGDALAKRVKAPDTTLPTADLRRSCQSAAVRAEPAVSAGAPADDVAAAVGSLIAATTVCEAVEAAAAAAAPAAAGAGASAA